MTAQARITQADMERATKSVKAAGYEHARIIMDLNKQRIEVIIGESVEPGSAERNPFDED